MQECLYSLCRRCDYQTITLRCSHTELLQVWETCRLISGEIPLITTQTKSFRINDFILECDSKFPSKWISEFHSTADYKHHHILILRKLHVKAETKLDMQYLEQLSSKCEILHKENKFLKEQVKERDHDLKWDKINTTDQDYNEFNALKSRISVLQHFLEEKNNHILQLERQLLKYKIDTKRTTNENRKHSLMPGVQDSKPKAHLNYNNENNEFNKIEEWC